MQWKELFDRRNHKGYKVVQKHLKQLGFKKNFEVFNVVGTNGKGSVAKYLSDSFMASGKKVGLFTSPHIFKPNERIKINNKDISNKEFFKLAEGLDFSFFETLFIVAMLHFQNQGIDIAIVEAGIGGLMDTTRAVPGDYGVVTSIGLDHINILGNTLIKIAKNKAGIINKGMKFFVPTSLDAKLRKFFVGNISLIKNKDNNYKKENIKLASGILKELNINPVIKAVPYRTTIHKKNGFNAIKDVAHNEDGIQASLKYLENNNIQFQRVVVSIQKIKWTDSIKSLFKNKEVVFYKNGDEYYSDGNEVNNLTKEYDSQDKDTLYIGTFRTIELLKDKKDIKGSVKRIILGNAESTKMTIFTMTIGALLISISQTLGYFLRFKLGPMEISLDYMFYMIFGLFFGILYGSIFALVIDLLKSVFIVGFGGWMWQYAILPPVGIVVISSLFKEFAWNKRDKWLLMMIVTFILTDIIALTTVLINNATSTYMFRHDHSEMMTLFYIFLPLILIIQIVSLILYLKITKKKLIRRFINSMALTTIIIVIFSWIWGPYAFVAFMNRFYDHHYTLTNKYTTFLIPRVIKAIPEGFIWSIILFSTYEVIEISTKKMLRNRW